MANLQDGRFVEDPRSEEIFAEINIPDALEYAVSRSKDERELFFTRAFVLYVLERAES